MEPEVSFHDDASPETTNPAADAVCEKPACQCVKRKYATWLLERCLPIKIRYTAVFLDSKGRDAVTLATRVVAVNLRHESMQKTKEELYLAYRAIAELAIYQPM